MYYLVNFEHVAVWAVINALKDSDWNVLAAWDYPKRILVSGDANIEGLRDLIWSMNGGAWCTTEVMDADEADQYM